MVIGPMTAGSALVWTRLGEGNIAVAGLVSVTSVALAPLVTPLLLALSVGANVSVASLSIFRELAIVVGSTLASAGGVGTVIVTYYVVEQLASGLVVGILAPAA